MNVMRSSIEQMTRDEYFAAVLLVVGPPSGGAVIVRDSYRVQVMNTMAALAKLGPHEHLTTSDFVQWYWRQRAGVHENE